MTVTSNNIDLSQPQQGSATTLAVRNNFAAIDTALTTLTNAVNSGTTIAPILAAIAAIPAAQLGTIEKTGSATAGTYSVTAFAKTVLAAATAAAAQTVLGLGSAATQPSTAFALVGHTHNAFALPLFVPDSGSGGTQGLVPAPGAGTGAAKAVLAADGTWGGLRGSIAGTIAGGGNLIDNVLFGKFSELSTNRASVSGSVTFNFTDGTYQRCVLNGNATIAFGGFPPAGYGDGIVLLIQQDNTGSRTATFPGVRWAAATPPSVTAAANAISIFTFLAGLDGTNTVYGFTGGLAFG